MSNINPFDQLAKGAKALQNLQEQVSSTATKAKLGFLDYAKVTLNGALKALKGAFSTVAAPLMGAFGALGPGEVWEIQKAPFWDWPTLWNKKRKEVNKDRGVLSIFGNGLWGLISGAGVGLVSGVKDGLAGLIQTFGGGAASLAYLKEKFPKEVIDAAVKTGHPMAYMASAVWNGVDGVNAVMQKLNAEIEKFPSLEEFMGPVQGAYAKIASQAKAAGDQLTAGLADVKGKANQFKDSAMSQFAQMKNQVTSQARSAVDQAKTTVDEARTTATNKFREVQSEAEQAITSARGTVEQSVASARQLAAEQEKIIKGKISGIQDELTRNIGIAKEQITMQKDAIVVKGKDALAGVKQILQDPGFEEVRMGAGSKAGAIKALIKGNDPDVVNKISNITLKDKSTGVVVELDPEEVEQIKAEVLAKIVLARQQKQSLVARGNQAITGAQQSLTEAERRVAATAQTTQNALEESGTALQHSAQHHVSATGQMVHSTAEHLSHQAAHKAASLVPPPPPPSASGNQKKRRK